MSAVNLVAVFVENKPGQTARITKLLADAGVNIRWVTIANSGSFGVMKFLVDQHDTAVRALKDKGLMVSLLEVLAVEVPDKPGSLQAVADLLGRNNINLDNCSGFVANNRAILVIEVHEIAQARAVLEKQGLHLLSQEEMLRAVALQVQQKSRNLVPAFLPHSTLRTTLNLYLMRRRRFTPVSYTRSDYCVFASSTYTTYQKRLSPHVTNCGDKAQGAHLDCTTILA